LFHLCDGTERYVVFSDVKTGDCFNHYSFDLYHHINVKEDLSSWFSIFCLILETSKGYLLQVRLELTTSALLNLYCLISTARLPISPLEPTALPTDERFSFFH